MRHAFFFNHVFFILSICNVCHRFSRRPNRIVPRFYAEPRLIFCVSSDLDPIGDRNDVYICPPLMRPPIPGRGSLAHAPDRAGPAGPCPAPCAGAVGPPSVGPGGGRPQRPLREGPAHWAGHGPAGPARSGAWARLPRPGMGGRIRGGHI